MWMRRKMKGVLDIEHEEILIFPLDYSIHNTAYLAWRIIRLRVYQTPASINSRRWCLFRVPLFTWSTADIEASMAELVTHGHFFQDNRQFCRIWFRGALVNNITSWHKRTNPFEITMPIRPGQVRKKHHVVPIYKIHRDRNFSYPNLYPSRSPISFGSTRGFKWSLFISFTINLFQNSNCFGGARVSVHAMRSPPVSIRILREFYPNALGARVMGERKWVVTRLSEI